MISLPSCFHDRFFILLCDQILDASWYMPADKRNPFQEYKVSLLALAFVSVLHME